VFFSWRKGTWSIVQYEIETDATLYAGYGLMVFFKPVEFLFDKLYIASSDLIVVL
jgi:hypothetical protein